MTSSDGLLEQKRQLPLYWCKREIKNFDTLKAVVEDMQAKKDVLGIQGVFASTSLKAGEDWRWQTHTMNVPVYYEYKDDDVTDKEKLEFTHSDEYKNIFDLYLNNSCTDPKMLGSKSLMILWQNLHLVMWRWFRMETGLGIRLKV